MILQERIELLCRLGQYINSNNQEWLDTKERAFNQNQWFVPEFIESATQNIAQHFLQEQLLKD